MRSNRVRFLSAGLLVGAILSDGAGQAQQSRCPQDTRAEDVATRFVIHGGAIKMPLGAFLLVRKSGQIGAIRLTSIDPNATELFGKSTYESIFERNASPTTFSRNAVTQNGELDVQDLKGPGRGIYIHRPAGYKAHIGKWTLDFKTPDSMWMSGSSLWTGQGDHRFEFAPTSACQLSDIDATDKRLRWFRFNRDATVTLPLADLPK